MTVVSKHVLIVDDDADVCRMVSEYLGEFDMRVSIAAEGQSMRRILEHSVVDLVLLDLKLPGEDGMSLTRDLRAKSGIPIIMLTSRKDDVDRIMGLELGADDYLTKPFSLRELVARIHALLRRAQYSFPVNGSANAVRAMRFGGWELDLRTRRLTDPEGERVELTRAEYALLAAFLGAPQRILNRDQLLELSRGNGEDVFDRSIDVLILRLRRKIELDPSRPTLIRTERGAGYVFNAHVESVT